MFCFLWDFSASPTQWGHVCLRLHTLQSCTLIPPWELEPRKDDLPVQNWVEKMVDLDGLGLAQCTGWWVSEECSIMCIIRAWYTKFLSRWLDFTISTKKLDWGMLQQLSVMAVNWEQSKNPSHTRAWQRKRVCPKSHCHSSYLFSCGNIQRGEMVIGSLCSFSS